MKILNMNDNEFQVFGDDLRIDTRLKPAVYTVNFAKMKGFFLRKHAPLTVTEKLYGEHTNKIEKIMRSFKAFDRSLGVIFSGEKGLGKSVACRRLCEKMNAEGYPVILVDNYIPGIANFIDTIQQECVIMFDEFDKTFQRHDDIDPQNELLSLFDGMSSNAKRLYVVTCNYINQLNNFIINRPGRFHYHIRFDFPSPDEIREYLMDKVDPQYQNQIEDVIQFSCKAEVNYDCLRAIAFELNQGEKFKEAVNDLNILNTGTQTSYIIHGYFENGLEFFGEEHMNLFTSSNVYANIYTLNRERIGEITFNAKDMTYDATTNSYYLNPNSIKFDGSDDFIEDEDAESAEKAGNGRIVTATIRRKPAARYRYNF